MTDPENRNRRGDLASKKPKSPPKGFTLYLDPTSTTMIWSKKLDRAGIRYKRAS